MTIATENGLRRLREALANDASPRNLWSAAVTALLLLGCELLSAVR